jgi:hypothetical protein
MRFYTKAHKHYCGIDLHARTMYVCVLGSEGGGSCTRTSRVMRSDSSR